MTRNEAGKQAPYMCDAAMKSSHSWITEQWIQGLGACRARDWTDELDC